MMRVRARANATREVSMVIQPASPLLGNVGRGARAAGGVKYEVAGVGGHQDAALDRGCRGLHHVRLILFRPSIFP